METKVRLFTRPARAAQTGRHPGEHRSSPEIYVNEWAPFSTKDFPENHIAKPGDTVKTITMDFADRTPCLDIYWPHESYLKFSRAGFEIVEMRKPLKGKFTHTFMAVTLPKNTDFYNQSGIYAEWDDAAEFMKLIKEQVAEESSVGFSSPQRVILKSFWVLWIGSEDDPYRFFRG